MGEREGGEEGEFYRVTVREADRKAAQEGEPCLPLLHSQLASGSW